MPATDIVAIIMAAGTGSRSGLDTPKQFTRVAGKPMVAHSHGVLSTHPRIDRVLTVIGEGQAGSLADAVGDATFVIGGATRRASVRAGLEAIDAEGGARLVLIHDAARPYLPPALIDRMIDALDTHAGAIPALPVADTLVRVDGDMGDVVARDGLYRVQTPQAFAFDVVLAAHRAWPETVDATDDAQMVRAMGHEVMIVEGDRVLEKLTHAADFAAHSWPVRMVSRTASGFDVHRLEDGEKLWLGGILIPHDRGLSGHSDADVALHAITDALLGTIAAGDIGMHFPPGDPQWRGASSAQFLEHAAMLVERAGGTIDFIDLTLICEAPKIGPHRLAMQARIAALLRLQPAQVSIKATTTERLGFTGRSEGIAAQATATISISGAA